MPKKKKEELPVFVVIEMKPWKDKILNLVLKVLRVPGQAWVIGVDDTGFMYDGDNYTDRKTRLKISKKVIAGAQGD
jgi:hypothetical protein